LEQQGISNPPCPDLRYVYTGAGPLDMTLKNRVEATFNQPLHHGYGLSEYAGAVCLVKTGIKRNDTSAGYAVEGGEVRVVNEQDQVLPAGERGEIWMRGIGLMPGYFRDPEATAQVFKPGGWYASGDIGYIDKDGALFVVGRLKEMIIRSGFNVYPGEVEAVINGYVGIEKCAVVGKKEADGNEEVLAFIELKSGALVHEDELRRYLTENLAPYKRPSKIIFVKDFPMTHSGKIIKRLLVS
jgi:long-chain acyl-CoA synthetase